MNIFQGGFMFMDVNNAKNAQVVHEMVRGISSVADIEELTAHELDAIRGAYPWLAFHGECDLKSLLSVSLSVCRGMSALGGTSLNLHQILAVMEPPTEVVQ